MANIQQSFSTCIVLVLIKYGLSARVCYDRTQGPNGNLGCFEDVGDFSNLNLPENPNLLNTRHLLFTSAEQTIETAEVLIYNDTDSIRESRFNSKYPTRILAHGFTENFRSEWQKNFKNLVFEREVNANVILVDWERGARGPQYWNAAPNTQIVGAQTARLLAHLIQIKGANPKNVHMTGISLGAQMSGFTSKRLFAFVKQRLGRITGLDPAGPLFETAPITARLDKTDADLVDIIHGNGVPVYNLGFGISKQIGHIDFYPNGGTFQTGCPTGGSAIQNLLNLDFDNLSGGLACSHVRAVYLLVESMRHDDCNFVSIPCESYERFQNGECTSPKYLNQAAKMGMYVINSPTPMKHFLLTHGNESEGFCGGAHLKITIRASKNSVDAKGQFTLRLHGQNGAVDVPIVIAKQEKLLPGKELVELAISRVKITDVSSMELMYERMCYQNMCWSEKIRVESVVLEEIAGQRSRIPVKACFHNLLLTSGEWSRMETTDSSTVCEIS